MSSGPSRIDEEGLLKSILVAAGIAAVTLYGIGDLASGLLYAGYSFRDQAISELSAFGSPERPVMVTVIVVHGVLLVVFGIGVLDAADRPSLRWVGILLVATGVIGFRLIQRGR